MFKFAAGAWRRHSLGSTKGKGSHFWQNRIRFVSTAAPKLEGKVALITGGASGIGAATAELFILHGARVVLADMNGDLGVQTASRLGPSARFVPCNVTDEQQVSDAVDAAVAEHGRLDIMYNNAGVPGPWSPAGISELDLAEFDQVMAINVRGALAGIKHAARVMVPQGSGSMLCTASVCGLMAGLAPLPYTVSKFAVPGLVRSAASELGRHGIRVNCVSPFVVTTPMVMSQLSAFYPNLSREKILQMVAGLGELAGSGCEERDVAQAALFLASDDAKYVNGHNLVVDGGFTTTKTLPLPPAEM